MTTLEIVLSMVIGLVYPGIWYLQRRINDLEIRTADRKELKEELEKLELRLEKDIEEIKKLLQQLNNK